MKKEFDSMQMMREIRDKLHRKYEKDPGFREKNLDRVRKKYGIGKKLLKASVPNAR